MKKLHTHTIAVGAMSIALAVTLILLPAASAQEDRHPPRNQGGPHGLSQGEGHDLSPEQRHRLRTERRGLSAGEGHDLTQEDRHRLMKERMTRMQTHMQLNDQQISTLQPILTEQGRKADAIRQQFQSGEVDREKLRAAMHDLRTTTNQQVAAVLTDEQFKQYVERRQHDRRGRGPRGNEGRGPRGEGHGPRGGEGGHGPRGGGPDGGHRGPPPHRPGDNPER